MNLKLLILLISALWKFSVYSQKFSEIKNQVIEVESLSEEKSPSFITNIYSFIGNDFDSLDAEILLTGPVLGFLIVDIATKEDSVTYGHLYDKFLEIKQNPQYFEIRNKQLVARELMKRPADFSNWEKDKSLFMELGFEDDLLENLRLYIKENSNSSLSYEYILIGFREQVDQQKSTEQKTKLEDIRKLDISSSSFDEIELLAQSKSENKPILLYFTGLSCINCRRIEQAVLFEPEVTELIMKEFIFVPLYIDDKTILPKDQQKEVLIGEHTEFIKTIGGKYMHYQISRFNVSNQPYFVALSSENKILDTTDYERSNSSNDYLLFLNNSLEKFNK